MKTRTKLSIAAVFAVTGTIAAAMANTWLTALARKRVPQLLSERFDSDVEIRNLTVAVFPRPLITGEGLVFRKRGRRDVPPLITLSKFRARTGLLALISGPRHVRSVVIEGLHIQVPPKSERIQEPGRKEDKGKPSGETPVVVDELTSENARLDILPKIEGKPPMAFLIHRLRMHQLASDRPAPFEAVLTNAKPKGEIETRGEFGPWQADDPGETPLHAQYTLKNADLNTIRGISGILSSSGKFGGVLRRIEADGTTETPDFSVDIAQHKVPLHTTYHAIIDGTNGDTLLKPVNARFLNSTVLADGGVVRDESGQGRRVTLDVIVRDARLEDVLKFAVKGGTPLTGRISFRTRFDLPPGDEDIVEKLRLDGEFGISNSQFTKLNVREKLETLSRKGQGKPEDEDAGSAISNFTGRFSLNNGVVSFPNLRFSVTGAAVHLSGTYGLKSEALDFRGSLRLDATVSQTTTGFKSVLLKLVDPLFKKKGAGTVLPIRVEGTRSNPKFGLDKGRVFSE